MSSMFSSSPTLCRRRSRLAKKTRSKHLLKSFGGGKITAHAVHAAARRGGSRAKIESFERSPVHSNRRAKKELAQTGRATIDVASDKVGVALFKLERRHDTALDDQVSKARREALDLLFDAVGHVECRT